MLRGCCLVKKAKGQWEGSLRFLSSIHRQHRGLASANSEFASVIRTNTSKVELPQAIFPWRHEETLLPRLRPEDDEENTAIYGPGLPSVPRHMEFAMTHVAGWQMQIPWYQLFSTGWKNQLADSGSWAFSQAVAGIVSNTYNVPLEQIQTGDSVNFVVVSDRSQSKCDVSANSDDEQPDVRRMLEENLRSLYESAHKHGKTQLKIELQCKPRSSEFLSLLWIPFLTRDAIDREPTLRGAIPSMYQSIVQEEIELGRSLSPVELFRRVMSHGLNLSNSQMVQHEEFATLESTLIAQALVHCDEIFRVIDLGSGKVVQGRADGKIRRVSHVVRLEVVTRTKITMWGPTTEVGSWQITDWDDMLGGNIWFL